MPVPIPLILLSLLHVTTCNVYTVRPDDGDHYYPNTTCHHCHNLQHYLLNITKYFTSNTQLVFLPGVHYLQTYLTIQNVHNISLTGSMVNDMTPVTIIQYYSRKSGITLINCTKVTIKHFVLTNLLKYGDVYFGAILKIFNCHYTQLHNMIVDVEIKGHNIMGKSKWSNITSHRGLDITYDDNVLVQEAMTTHWLEIYNYTPKEWSYNGINIELTQTFYGITIFITESVFSSTNLELTFSITSSCTTHENTIILNKNQFANNKHMWYLLNIQFDLHNCSSNETIIKHDKFIINNSLFIDNRNIKGIIHCKWSHEVKNIIQNLFINSCLIKNTKYCINIMMFTSDSIVTAENSIHIVHTHFISNVCNDDIRSSTLVNSDNMLILKGPILIHGNIFTSILSAKHKGVDVAILNYVEFSENQAIYMVQYYHSILLLHQHAEIKITKNFISYFFVSYKIHNLNDYIPTCYFQFYGNEINNNSNIFRITIEKNTTNSVSRIFSQDTENINCKMLSGSLFYEHNPLHVYQQFIHFQTNLGLFPFPFDTGMFCYCTEEMQKCNVNQLGPIFPGQTLSISLCINHKVEPSIKYILGSIEMYNQFLPKSHCKVPLLHINSWITRNCTKLYYVVLSNNQEQCELFLNARKHKYITIFYIKLLKCPLGFSFDDNTEKCECDSSMQSKLLPITNCNINDQTILRPANSWLSANTHNNSSIYHLTPNCPFHYCLPQSSHLNFSTPNSQCQFNRSGLLCGQCQQNLSAIFGSSNCQLCSNIYLLLLIPITIAGLLLVFILFCINLTVTDGTINAFIMYTNIIGINDHVFFTDTKHVFTPAYTFISLANLDLGIQTCFYNGMDDYAKMWLQLAFPFYLMFIATLLIITSRYSITVQRLTARRALPVLATLFLLSYTKILHTVSSVLFSYSTITHLPSKHTTMVWSVDANVPLFGIKFTILFIVCLILFLVLVPFNIILLCTRTLSQFQFINKFKPLLVLTKDHTNTGSITGLVCNY